MKTKLPIIRRILLLSAALAPGLAVGHAMPVSIAEDQIWRLWPDGVVAYEFVEQAQPASRLTPEPQLPPDAITRKAIQDAMLHIQQRTAGAIVFVPSHTNPNRVRISLMPSNPDTGYCGMASLGYFSAGGTLQITDRPACKTRAVALHEFMHTLGFLHENQRFQAMMDRERRPEAESTYADKNLVVDHDSITYNDGLQGERLDLIKESSQVLLVRLRYGLGTTGRWFQELSKEDVASILHYYPPERTLAKQLENAARTRPDLKFTRLEPTPGRCLQTGSADRESTPPYKLLDRRYLFVTECDTVSPGQRWALDRQGALINLAYPGKCVSKLSDGVRGFFAILAQCRNGDPHQQWQAQGAKLINRATPERSLGYDPINRNMLVWESNSRLQSDWQRNAAPATRPTGLISPDGAPPEPLPPQPTNLTPAANQVLRLQLGGRCLSNAGRDSRLRDPDERLTLLQPCNNSPAQRWIFDQGRIASLQEPAYCLGNTGLHLPTRDDKPAFAGLQRCRQDRPSQRWALKAMPGSEETMIVTRVNPLVADDYRLLEAMADGMVHMGTANSARHAVAWRVGIETLPGQRPAITIAPPVTTPTTSGLSGAQIRLLGGNLPAPAQCLEALDGKPRGFADDEIGLGTTRCDANAAAQRWNLSPSGQLSTPARPGLCIGRNRARAGQEIHGSYTARAVRHTGFVALQPCRKDEPTQQWEWRTTRYHHQGEKPGESGAQLVQRLSPDLSLVVDGKARGPQLSISQADIANNFQFFRWQPAPGQTVATTLPGKLGGMRTLDWARPEANWDKSAPGYVGRGINMAERKSFRQLVWQDNRQCLGLRPDGSWRLALVACRKDAPDQGWRIDEQYRLSNQRFAKLCLLRDDRRVVLGDCADRRVLQHWFFNDGYQLESLDFTRMWLAPGNTADIVLDVPGYPGQAAGNWRWN